MTASSAYALFIDPPLGRVGMTEARRAATGRRLLVGTRPMTRVGRAVEKGETRGFMKVVVDADTQRILGAAILGIGGDEAIHGILDMMNAGLPCDGAALGGAHPSDGLGAHPDRCSAIFGRRHECPRTPLAASRRRYGVSGRVVAPPARGRPPRGAG